MVERVFSSSVFAFLGSGWTKDWLEAVHSRFAVVSGMKSSALVVGGGLVEGVLGEYGALLFAATAVGVFAAALVVAVGCFVELKRANNDG